MIPRFVAGVAALALVAGAAVGCSPAPPALSPEVTVTVYQPRTDIALGRLALQVRNGTDSPLEVVAARLTSPDFLGDVVWPGETATVPAGLALDLRAPLPEVECSADPAPRARLEVRIDGRTVSAELPVEDPFGLLPRLREEACLAAAIADIATITPREILVTDPNGPAVLVLDVVPSGAAGTILLQDVGGTTLLQPARDGGGVDRLDLGIAIDAAGPAEVRVEFVPNRCDAHALAEDKVGTIIPFTVSTPAVAESRWLLPATAEQRGRWYAYVAAYCGLPGA